MSEELSTEPFFCFYECHKCRELHRCDNHVFPPSVVMVAGAKKNEWVFECVSKCKDPE